MLQRKVNALTFTTKYYIHPPYTIFIITIPNSTEFKGIAKCLPTDKFNREFGIELAQNKAMLKYLKYLEKECSKACKDYSQLIEHLTVRLNTYQNIHLKTVQDMHTLQLHQEFIKSAIEKQSSLGKLYPSNITYKEQDTYGHYELTI